MITKIFGNKRGLQRFFIISLGCLIILGVYARFGGFDVYSSASPPFSHQECLKRHQNYYFDRNPDMLELTDDQISIIARACAVEESDYYYSN